MRKGQYSMEYMFTVGMGMMILLVILGLYWYYQRSSVQETDAAVVKAIGQDLVNNVNVIASSGGFGLKKLEIGAPEKIKAMYIEGNYSKTLILNYSGPNGIQSAIFLANAKMADLLDKSRSPGAIYLLRSHSGAIALCDLGNCSCSWNTTCCAVMPCAADTQLCVSGTKKVCTS